jgi:hypothetical protein
MINTADLEQIAKLKEQNIQKQREIDKMNANLSAGLNPDGSPKSKEFDSLIDPATGLMKAPYQVGKIDPSKFDSYSMIKALATGKGLTETGELQKQQIEQMGIQGKESAARNAAAATAAARSGMAMRGGVGAGARERLAAGGAQNLMEATQGQNRATQGQLLQNLLSDQSRRDQALQGFAGMEQGLAGKNLGIDQYNIEQALKETGSKRANEQEQYKEQLDKWASNKQAEATRASSSGGKK